MPFGPQATGTVVRRMPGKLFPNRHLPGWLWSGQPVPMPRVVGARGHARHLVELAHGNLGPALGDILVGAHRVGWPKMTKAFFKISNSYSARLRRARSAHTSGSRATLTLPTSATSCACCQR